jgi:Fic family protein
VYLLWIHPFADGNGRCARLAEACVLLEAGFPAVAARVPVEFYAATRAEYLRQLELATRERSLTSFISYATRGLRDGLRRLFRLIGTEQFESAWRGLVLDRFEGHPHRSRKVVRRRLELMLALPLDGTRDLEEIASLNQRIEQLYSGLSRRTLRRDLDSLAQTGLVTVTRGRFAANTGELRLR